MVKPGEAGGQLHQGRCRIRGRVFWHLQLTRIDRASSTPLAGVRLPTLPSSPLATRYFFLPFPRPSFYLVSKTSLVSRTSGQLSPPRRFLNASPFFFFVSPEFFFRSFSYQESFRSIFVANDEFADPDVMKHTNQFSTALTSRSLSIRCYPNYNDKPCFSFSTSSSHSASANIIEPPTPLLTHRPL